MKKNWKELVRSALAEDIGPGDITANLVPQGSAVRAIIIAKERGVIAGLPMAQQSFLSLNPRVKFQAFKKDGQDVAAGEKVLEIFGPLPILLSAERTSLNFLSRISGIATLTRKFVEKAAGTKADIFDTRKTTPTLRALEKYAVKAGGGKNHRFGLFDGILIKDNHISALSASKKVRTRLDAITNLLKEARKKKRNPPQSPYLDGSAPAFCKGGKREIRRKGIPIEVEVENIKEALTAASAGADIILFDNMSPEKVRAVRKELIRMEFKGKIEVSGGITLQNVRAYALAGVDRISIGRLTHSAPALDFSLEIIS